MSDLNSTARLVGAYVWLERRLFEVLGTVAARGGASPELPVLLDTHSRHHAWHSSLFAEHLPRIHGLDPASLVVSPSPAVTELMSAVEDANDATQVAGLLARVVLPRLVTTYRRHLRGARPASDGPLARTLRLALRDEVEAWTEIEELLEELLREAGRVGAVWSGSIEERLAGAGPGLVPWPT